MLSWLQSGSVQGHCVEGLWSGFNRLVVQYLQDLVDSNHCDWIVFGGAYGSGYFQHLRLQLVHPSFKLQDLSVILFLAPEVISNIGMQEVSSQFLELVRSFELASIGSLARLSVGCQQIDRWEVKKDQGILQFSCALRTQLIQSWGESSKDSGA